MMRLESGCHPVVSTSTNATGASSQALIKLFRQSWPSLSNFLMILRPTLESAPMATDYTLDSFWMPFTANRQFKAKPRLLARASGMHYWTPEGRQILDGSAGLWCVNAGHGRREISEAVARQLETLDYAPP